MRTLSSITFQLPSLWRTRSHPATCVYTPPGGLMPWTARAKCEQDATSRHGTIPSCTISRVW